MTTLVTPRLHLPRPGLLARLRRALGLRSSRRALASLDDHMLADIGLTRDEAEREALRPVWDAPESWQTRL